jgi:Uma2 family endonuclease
VDGWYTGAADHIVGEKGRRGGTMTTPDPSTADLLGLVARGPVTVDDLPEDVQNVRIELVDGSVYVTPLGDVEHQDLVMRYAVRIRHHLPDSLRVLPGVNVIVGDQTLVIPDVAVVDPSFVVHRGLGIAPDGLRLAVEITSPSTRRRDLTLKRELYREWGVPFLVVDRSTTPFTLHKDGDLPPFAEVLTTLGDGA